VDKTYDGPKLDVDEDGKYKITREFVEGMITWFKDGKAIPKRYVWEIVLGAHAHFVKEASLVEVKVDEGMTCDVIGDVHGEWCRCEKMGGKADQMHRTVLRCATSVLIDGISVRYTLSSHERRPRGPRLVVDRGHFDCVRLEV
jgi:hypothetical protein